MLIMEHREHVVGSIPDISHSMFVQSTYSGSFGVLPILMA